MNPYDPSFGTKEVGVCSAWASQLNNWFLLSSKPYSHSTLFLNVEGRYFSTWLWRITTT